MGLCTAIHASKKREKPINETRFIFLSALLPLLTPSTEQLARAKDLFWDWGDGIARQRDGWKIHRYGTKLAPFNSQQDPNEFNDLQRVEPGKFQAMQAALMARYDALPENGRSTLLEPGRIGDENVYVDGAPADAKVDPRYLHPYQDGKPTAYPTPLQRAPKP